MTVVAWVTVTLVWTLAPATAAAASRATPTGPRLDRAIEAIPVTGRVFVTVPGGARARLRGALAIPVGSIVDTRRGDVRVINATNGRGGRQTAQFSGGQFQALQPAGDGGTLEVQLVGGDFAACKRSSAARAGGGQVIRHLNTKGGYETRAFGRNGSARGGRPRSGRAVVAASGAVAWDTVDRCDGTVIVDHFGEVDTSAQSVPVAITLTPDETVAYYCGAAAGVSRAYCEIVRGVVGTQPGTDAAPTVDRFVATLVTKRPAATQYDLTIDDPEGYSTNTTYPLGPAGTGGFRRSDVFCVPNRGVGIYQIGWRLDGIPLTVIDFTAPVAVATTGPCTSSPLGRDVPSDLTQSVASAQGHFVVHYTTDPVDKDDDSTAQAAAVVAQTAESALAYETTTLGMPQPLTAPLDIYIESQTSHVASTYLAPPTGQVTLPADGQPTAAYIVLPPAEVANTYVIAYTLFGALRDAIGRIIGIESGAFTDSTDAWAANNFTQSSTYTPVLSQSLDCALTCTEPDGGWRFYQHLAEQYGSSIVEQLFAQDAADDRAQAGSHFVQALGEVLAVHGTTLATQLASYALEDLTVGWQAPWVGGKYLAHTPDGITDTVPAAGGTLEELSPVVNHLALRYVWLSIGARRPCVTDVLTLDVQVPAGGAVSGASVVTGGAYQIAGATPLPSGAQQIQATFGSCSSTAVRLPLVNATAATDGLPFTVTGTLVRGAAPAPAIRRATG